MDYTIVWCETKVKLIIEHCSVGPTNFIGTTIATTTRMRMKKEDF